MITASIQFIDSLFKQGSGEFPVLYQRLNNVHLGKMSYEKENLVFKDVGVLTGREEYIDTEYCGKYIPGMICYSSLLEWKSLSFYGVEYCRLSTEIDSDIRDSLLTIKNQQGNRLYDFIGSIYQAYQLLIADYLPIVLLKPVTAHNKAVGLAIADLCPVLKKHSGTTN